MNALSKINGLNLLLLVFMIVSLTVIKSQTLVELDKTPTPVILKDDLGSRINGEAWDSNILKDKINLILYVAPSQQDVIEPLLEKVNEQNYPKELFETTLILNTSATWIPNSIIEGKVESKAEEDSSITYVLDKEEVLLEQWNLSEDYPNIILVDDNGKVSFISKEEFNEKIEGELLHQIELEIEMNDNKGVRK
ncbi:MAG: hypothetical protein HND52_08055 [Ignavibacteriae bacterium]|nr:hypothetical protein [Ignavibacteriota bacterium]